MIQIFSITKQNEIQERAAAENGQDNSGFKTDVEKGDQLFGN